MNNSNKNSKSETKFKDLLEDLNYFKSNQKDVIKNTSSNNELSMMRFLMNQRNQFRRQFFKKKNYYSFLYLFR